MIEVEHLSRHYGQIRAVDDVSFVANPGRVTGFLGPNGAGKSTAMRAMTDLTPPTSGSVRILGRRYRDLPTPGRHVGVLLDASAQHDGRTGAEIMRLGARMTRASQARVTELLDLVGLSGPESKRRVKQYSLGMRQRLGIAHALLGEPSVLILDEPANGLDPQGIRWMRELVRRFADDGGTVLLSSHLLQEVEAVADDLVVIGAGRIVAQGPIGELLGRAGTTVRALEPDHLAGVLAAEGAEFSRKDDVFTLAVEPVDVGRLAARHSVVLTELTGTSGRRLEDAFLDLTTARGTTTETS